MNPMSFESLINVTPINSIDENTILFQKEEPISSFTKSSTLSQIKIENKSERLIVAKIIFKLNKYYCVKPCHYFVLEPGRSKIADSEINSNVLNLNLF